MANVKPIPEGYHSLTPYLMYREAARAIDYYKNVFGAKVRVRMDGPNGRVAHAELEIGDSLLMLADETPQTYAKSPDAAAAPTNGLHLYVEDADAIFDKAVKAGAKVLRPLANQFYGDRSASFLDPFGQMWTVSTHVEDVSAEELKKRMTKASTQTAGN
jgi:PhnB protein